MVAQVNIAGVRTSKKRYLAIAWDLLGERNHGTQKGIMENWT